MPERRAQNAVIKSRANELDARLLGDAGAESALRRAASR
jgi:hypothetical protein